MTNFDELSLNEKCIATLATILLLVVLVWSCFQLSKGFITYFDTRSSAQCYLYSKETNRSTKYRDGQCYVLYKDGEWYEKIEIQTQVNIF